MADVLSRQLIWPVRAFSGWPIVEVSPSFVDSRHRPVHWPLGSHWKFR